MFGSLEWLAALSSTFAAAIGAGAGAYAAFRLEENRRERERISLVVADGRRLLFDLFSIWNDLTQFKKEIVDPLEGDQEDYWFKMKPVPFPFSAKDRLAIGRTEFLLGTDGSNLAADLLIERQRFELFVSQVNERSRVMREFVRPKWEAAELQEFNRNEILRVTGPNHFAELRDMTENILKFLDEDIESSRKCFDNLRNHLKAQFKGQKFIDLKDKVQDDAQA